MAAAMGAVAAMMMPNWVTHSTTWDVVLIQDEGRGVSTSAMSCEKRLVMLPTSVTTMNEYAALVWDLLATKRSVFFWFSEDDVTSSEP